MKRFWFLSPKNIIASIRSVWQPLPTAEKPAECPDKLEPVGPYSGLYNRVMKSTTTGQQKSFSVFDVVTLEQREALEKVPVINGGGGAEKYGSGYRGQVRKPSNNKPSLQDVAQRLCDEWALIRADEFEDLIDEDMLHSLVRQNPESPHVHFIAGEYYLRNNEYSIAYGAFKNAKGFCDADADIYRALVHMARCCEFMKESDKAANLYKQAIGYNVYGFSAHIGLGNFYLNKGDIDKAQPFFSDAINIGYSQDHDDTAQAHVGVGQCYFIRAEACEDNDVYDKNLGKAYENFDYAQRFDASDPDPDLKIAKFFVDIGQPKRANEYIKAAREKALNFEDVPAIIIDIRDIASRIEEPGGAEDAVIDLGGKAEDASDPYDLFDRDLDSDDPFDLFPNDPR